MLLDWVTVTVPWECWGEQYRAIYERFERIQRYRPDSGEVVWETTAWESVRSDSHQVVCRATGQGLSFQGSPARVVGRGDAVFGEGPARALDLAGCVRAMAGFVARSMGLSELPGPVALWKVSRVDVTSNLWCGSLSAVRVALGALRSTEGGRYRVSQQAGDTVYWSHRSRLRSGKAYAKGPHLVYQAKQEQGCRYSREELQAAAGLLRLELRLGSQWWRERAGLPWWEFTAAQLRAEWEAYFSRMVGSGLEVAEMSGELDRLRAVAPEGRARAAYGTWLLIREHGWQQARELVSRPTWYRHLGVLRDAGLGDVDLSLGRVVGLRRLVSLSEVSCWEELHRLAG